MSFSDLPSSVCPNRIQRIAYLGERDFALLRAASVLGADGDEKHGAKLGFRHLRSYEETPVSEMTPIMRGAYDTTKGLRGLVPGPHKIWLANPALSNTIVPTGAYFQTQSTLTKAEIEIVTNLVTSRWHAAYASYEHEKIGQAQGHLPPDKIERIVAGLPVSFDDAREELICQLASALVAPRIVATGLYHRAKTLIGDAGIVDVAVLIGWFTMVSATLNAFDVPSNAVGLDQ